MAEAFRLAERILQMDQQNALAHLSLGVRAMRKPQFATARGHFQKAGGRGRNADLSAALLVAWTHVAAASWRVRLRWWIASMTASLRFFAITSAG